MLWTCTMPRRQDSDWLRTAEESLVLRLFLSPVPSHLRPTVQQQKQHLRQQLTINSDTPSPWSKPKRPPEHRAPSHTPCRSPAESHSSAQESHVHGWAPLVSLRKQQHYTSYPGLISLNKRQKHLAEQVRCMEMTTLLSATLLYYNGTIFFNFQQSLTLKASSLPAAWHCHKTETNSRGVKSFPSSPSQAAHGAEARGSFTRNGWPPQPSRLNNSSFGTW